MIECRLYKNGWIELPDGQIVAHEWLLERVFQKIDRPLTKEQIAETMRMFYEVGSEMGRYCVMGKTEERKVRIEFMKEDLDTSRNPALNN